MKKYIYINKFVKVTVGNEETVISNYMTNQVHVFKDKYNNIFKELLKNGIKVNELSNTQMEVIEFINENEIGTMLNEEYTQDNSESSLLDRRIYFPRLNIEKITIFANSNNKCINGCMHAKDYVKELDIDLLERFDVKIDKVILNIGYIPDVIIIDKLYKFANNVTIIAKINEIEIEKIDDTIEYIICIDDNDIVLKYESEIEIISTLPNVIFSIDSAVGLNDIYAENVRIKNIRYSLEQAPKYQESKSMLPLQTIENNRYYHPCLSKALAIDLDGNLFYCTEFKNCFLENTSYSYISEIFNEKKYRIFWEKKVKDYFKCSKCGYRNNCADCRVAYISKNYNCIKRNN